MTDTKLIRIHIDIKDVTAKIENMKKKIKEAESLGAYVMRRFTTFSRTTMRILGSVLRLTSAVTDVSLMTSILAGIQTQLTMRRLVLRAGVEFTAGNVLFGSMLLLQAGLLEWEYAANLANQEQMRIHLDRINAMGDMSG